MTRFRKEDFSNGFYVIKNLLDESEIKKYINCIKNKREFSDKMLLVLMKKELKSNF